MNAINSELSSTAPGQNSLFDNHLQSSAPGNKPHGSYSMSPLVTGGLSEISRLREELQKKNAQLNKFEEQTMVWQKEVEERNHKVRYRIPFKTKKYKFKQMFYLHFRCNLRNNNVTKHYLK